MGVSFPGRFAVRLWLYDTSHACKLAIRQVSVFLVVPLGAGMGPCKLSFPFHDACQST